MNEGYNISTYLVIRYSVPNEVPGIFAAKEMILCKKHMCVGPACI